MPARKTFTLISLLIIILGNAQRKKRRDTIVIYEKVVVYDTVFRTKAFGQNLAPVRMPKPVLNLKDIAFETPSLKKNDADILKDSLTQKSFRYGFSAGFGFKNNNWTTDNSSGSKPQVGPTAGIWLSKTLFAPQFTLLFSANLFYWNSSLNLDATKEEAYLDGFYFTEDKKPLLFQRFDNKHLEISTQLKARYEWKKLLPLAGIIISKSFYEMQFLVPENNVFNKPDRFKNKSIDLGFNLGLQYRLSRRISVDFEYQHIFRKGLHLKNKDFDFEIFKPNSNFAERKITAGLSYSLVK